MAAPTVTARVKPSGFKLPDGYRSTWAFALKPAIQLWEKTVKPPGVDGGAAIDQTTMHNDAWRTVAPRSLKTLTESSFKFAYDPDAYPDIIAMVNIQQSITCHEPDGSAIAIYGFLQKVEFDPLEEGKQPEGTATVTPTNYDPVNNIEAGPLFVPAAGT